MINSIFSAIVIYAILTYFELASFGWAVFWACLPFLIGVIVGLSVLLACAIASSLEERN